jgi:integrase
MKANVQISHCRAYGYLLDYTARLGLLDPNADAAAHVRPEILEGFLSELRSRVGSVTRWSYVQRTRRVAEILAPDQDFCWLREIASDLRHDARPRPKRHRIIDSARLLALGLDLIERGERESTRTTLRRARLVRDGLMIALLSVCPIRLKNLSSLRLGQQIRKVDGAWWIVLDAAETKSRRPDERPLADVLTPYIDRWVGVWRERFLNPGDAFWPSIKGGPMAYTYVGTIINETTRRELGVAVNPHLFRDCAVHTIADRVGEEMGLASALLQHADTRVTEKHYNKGKMVTAARRYQSIVENLEAKGPPDS